MSAGDGHDDDQDVRHAHPILVYLFAARPQVFGLAAYLVYAAFTGILVAETMRHSIPPTDPR